MAGHLNIPECGVLSRTLNPSPTIRWIIPARLRSASKNDVIFITNTSIQLREFLDNGQLADSSCTLELRTQILAAKIISAKIEIKPTLDAILDQSGEEERYLVNGQIIDEDLPPQILVLSTAISELIYVYAKDFNNGTIRFVFAKRPLLNGLSIPEKFGKHMAVDPESRALAVAPSKGSCAVLALRPIDQIKREIDNWKPSVPSSCRPTLEQRFTQVDGYILKMDFLRSTNTDPTKVILVLIVANPGETRLLLYQWDTRQPLIRMKAMRCSGQTLRTDDSFPSMLIPSSMTTSFILITETEIVLYDNITSSELKRIGFRLPYHASAKYRSQPNEPVWTQWAKPRRHIIHKDNHDDLFLVREDGLLLTYLITYKSPTRVEVEANFSPGSLGINVDAAFCILAGPRDKGGDIVIAGGDMTDGGVYHIVARGSPVRTQILANPSPVQDLILVETQAKSKTKTGNDASSRIFTCCGSGDNNGSIVELKYGIEAQVGMTMQFPDSASVERFWTLEIEGQKVLWLLSSHQLHTSLFIFNLDGQDEPLSADSDICPGLDFDSSTIAAAVIQQKLIIQVTRKNVNLIPVNHNSSPIRLPLNDTQCLCAEIQERDGTMVMAHTVADGYSATLCGFELDNEGQYNVVHAATSSTLGGRPTSMSSAYLKQTTIVVIGTENGWIHGFRTAGKEGLVALFEYQLSQENLQQQDCAITSICLLSNPWSKIGILLCGLRTGCLLCFEVRAHTDGDSIKLDLRQDALHKLGSTNVNISREDFSQNASKTSALILCESAVRRVTLISNEAGIDYEFHHVSLTSHESTSEFRPVLMALHRILQIKSIPNDERSGLVVAATSEEILFMFLIDQPHAVLSRSFFQGLPKRMAYIKQLNMLVTGVSSQRVRDQPGTNLSLREPNIETPQLRCLKLDDNKNFGNPQDITSAVPFGENGERIRCIMFWQPTDGQKHYDFLVVGLERTETGSSKRKGRVVMIRTKYLMGDHVADLKAKSLLRHGHPVTALGNVGKSTMLIAAGEELNAYHFDVTTQVWTSLDKFDLPSEAVSIASQGNYVYIATKYHSLLVLRQEDNKLKFHASDKVARTTNSLITLGGLNTVLAAVSDTGTSLISFAEDRITGGLYKVFAAEMPLIIDCLQQDRRLIAQNTQRYTFLGSTVDGTLYQFCTIRPEEWRLLEFLEGLTQFERLVRKKAPLSRHELLASPSPAERFNPAAMHVRGDILLMMIDDGPYNLRKLLEPIIKEENAEDATPSSNEKLARLKGLAEPLVGRNEDIVGAVMIWLRKLLKSPGEL